MSDKKLAPSILSADLTRLAQEINEVEEGGADWLHIDVMDGHFAPMITLGPIFVSAIRSITNLPLDVHLMIDNPDRFIEPFSEAGADILVVSIEACSHLHYTVQAIKGGGCKAGVCLNPATPLSVLEGIIEDIDLVTLLMVNPGFKGQKFISGLIQKVKDLRKMIDGRDLHIDIQADGGISQSNIAQVAKAGANVFVTGTAVFSTNDYVKAIQDLKEQIKG